MAKYNGYIIRSAAFQRVNRPGFAQPPGDGRAAKMSAISWIRDQIAQSIRAKQKSIVVHKTKVVKLDLNVFFGTTQAIGQYVIPRAGWNR